MRPEGDVEGIEFQTGSEANVESAERAPGGWASASRGGEAGRWTRNEPSEDASTTKGRWRRVALSLRDWEVLTWAHEQKFLMFDQVAHWFPEGAANPRSPRKPSPTAGTLRRRARPGNWYVLERLRKLVRFDVLRRVPVYTEAAAALLPGRLGFDLLIGSGRSHGLARLDDIDWKNFVHDRAATDLRWDVEKRLGGVRWQSERVLRRLLQTRHVPDALVDLAGQGTVAIELELTRKSLARYVGIFERYVNWATPRLDRVLYVVPEKADLAHVFKVVLPAVLASTALWGARSPDLSRFRFTTRAALPERRVWWTASTPNAPTAGEL
jgi:hypothetical protein